MKIINLVENTPGSVSCGTEHGLSFYIETQKHRILMDAGATGLFAENAGKLGISLANVDIVVLSHGHYDHGDGIAAFRTVNPEAKIYMQTSAIGDYWSSVNQLHYIGLSDEVKSLPGIIFVPPTGVLRIDDELSLFGGIGHEYPVPAGNHALKVRISDAFPEDPFDHEQCLVVTEKDFHVLFSGCAHHGILNILDRYLALFGESPTHVISGFHMMKNGAYTEEETQLIIDTAIALTKEPTWFCTCHCTGMQAYEEMEKIMGEQLCYVHCGEEIVLPEPRATAIISGLQTNKPQKHPPG